MRRCIELLLLAVGLVSSALFCGLSVPALLAKNIHVATQARDPERVLPAGSLGAAYGKDRKNIHLSAVIGHIRIPDLYIDAPIIEGIEDGDLRRGVGHVPGSAMAGGLGDVILAAHRDQIFRPLRDVRSGMNVLVQGPDGIFSYQVDKTMIVTPDKVDVMDISGVPEVTLITCYPFNYVGSAPMRFIVKAHLVSVSPVNASGF